MANISIKLSQAVVDTTNKLLLTSPATNNGSLGTVVDNILNVNQQIASNYSLYSTWSLIGSALRFNYSDGSTKIYTGVVQNSTSATQGTATATGMEFLKNGVLTYVTSGLTNFNYTLSGPASNQQLSLQSTTGTVQNAKVTALLPATSTSYNPDFGNTTTVINGAITIDASNNLNGTITQFSQTADKYLASEIATGNFKVSGNALTAGQGLTHASVTGELTGIKSIYRDGSFYDVNSISTTLSATQKFDNTIFADPSRFSSNDNISIDLPKTMYQDFMMASGSGDDKITINGGGGRLNVQAGEGNDVVNVLTGSHFIDGGAGEDTVSFASNIKFYSVAKSGSGYQIRTSGTTDIASVTNTERLHFGDLSINLSIKDIAATLDAGQLLRLEELYVAFFNRIPDADGLSYWIGELKAGKSLNMIAESFYTAGVQFSSLTGFSASMSNTEFVNVIYKNVLGRTTGADPEGLAYWTAALGNGSESRGSLVSTILNSAHTFKNDTTYGYVANLLDNKGIVANKFAVDMGLNYNSQADSIAHGIEIAAAVTAVDTTAAIRLIGVSDLISI